MRKLSTLLAATAVSATALALGRGVSADVDPQLPAYQTVQGVSGNLKSVGSDTLNDLMTFWTEGFYALYPNVKPEIEGKGSDDGAARADRAARRNFGPMSREMKAEEIDAFEKKFGYKPTGIARRARRAGRSTSTRTIRSSRSRWRRSTRSSRRRARAARPPTSRRGASSA